MTYHETLDNSAAQALLGADYEENCTYNLESDQDKFTLLMVRPDGTTKEVELDYKPSEDDFVYEDDFSSHVETKEKKHIGIETIITVTMIIMCILAVIVPFMLMRR